MAAQHGMAGQGMAHSSSHLFSNKGMGEREGEGGVRRKEILGTGSLATGNRNRLTKKRKRLFVLEDLILAV